MPQNDAVFAHAARFRRHDEFLAFDRQHIAAHDTGGMHPAGYADHEDDEDEDAGFRPEGRAQRIAEQHQDDEQQRQKRQGQEQVGQPHQRTVQISEIA